MRFTMREFEIHGVNGKANARFVIETKEGIVEYDEMLLRASKDDVSLLQTIEKFIRIKVEEQRGEVNG